MPFLPDIPQSTDQLSISQGNILNNFTILGAIAGNANASSGSINTSGTNSGFNWIYLPPNNATPPAGAAFPAGNVGIYSANNARTGFNEVYLNKTTAAGIVQIPSTACRLGGTDNGNGWTYLPSGLKMAWGRSTTGLSTNVTLLYANELTNFPGFLTPYNIPQLTRIAVVGATSNFVKLTNYTQTTFQVSSSLGTTGTNIQFSWFVIGA